MEKPQFLQLIFQHIATKAQVPFSAFIEDFKDSYKSSWNPKEVYGRMDPISTFKGTVRTISLTWNVPSNSLEEAKRNHWKAQSLVSMLYPSYEGNALSASPLMKVYLANFICDTSIVGKEGDGTANSGLICAVDGFTYNPAMDEGFYVVDVNKIYAQKIQFSCNLTVHHQHPMGWDEEGFSRAGLYPYGEKPPSDIKVGPGRGEEFEFTREEAEKINDEYNQELKAKTILNEGK